jgi:UDP-3-O-[3-hydroxymyristoyl] glucosamine N-acyltransferase
LEQKIFYNSLSIDAQNITKFRSMDNEYKILFIDTKSHRPDIFESLNSFADYSVLIDNNTVFQELFDCCVNPSFYATQKSFKLSDKLPIILSGIDQNSSISDNVKYEQDLYIGSYSVCKENSVLGKNVKIHSQVFIGENVSIGNNTIIFSGVKIYDNSIIGSDCIIHANTVIGSDGFGFNLDKNGNQLKVIHNGNVILEDSVELGANCTIDKATLGSTIIKKGVKIDNLVQVAHNVVIGENTVIAGLVGIAGSTTIGKNCMIGGQAGISGHLNIGDRVMIQAASAVFKSIKSDSTIMGYPAINYRDYSKSYIHFKNLPSVMKSLDKIFKSEKDG